MRNLNVLSTVISANVKNEQQINEAHDQSRNGNNISNKDIISCFYVHYNTPTNCYSLSLMNIIIMSYITNNLFTNFVMIFFPWKNLKII